MPPSLLKPSLLSTVAKSIIARRPIPAHFPVTSALMSTTTRKPKLPNPDSLSEGWRPADSLDTDNMVRSFPALKYHIKNPKPLAVCDDDDECIFEENNAGKFVLWNSQMMKAWRIYKPDTIEGIVEALRPVEDDTPMSPMKDAMELRAITSADFVLYREKWDTISDFLKMDTEKKLQLKSEIDAILVNSIKAQQKELVDNEIIFP